MQPETQPNGFCQCGCGETTTPAHQTDARRGYVKGQPQRFLPGHNQRRSTLQGLYRQVRAVGHPRASKIGIVYEHVIIAERALGRYLPDGVEVHHVNSDGRDNRPTNLVICQDRAYHKLLHVRTRVLKAGGNPNTERVCSICRQPKPFAAFFRRQSSPDGVDRCCRECRRERDRGRKRWKGEA